MARRKDSEEKSAPSEVPAALAAPALAAKPLEPVTDAAALDAPKLDARKLEAPASVPPHIQTIGIASADAPKLDLPKLDFPKPDAIKPLMAEDAPLPPIEPVLAAVASSEAPARASRFALLAACVAVAAACGSMAGALGASSLWRPAPATATAAAMATTGDETRALQQTIAQLRTDLAALKTSVEAGTKASNGQFAKVTERFDRVERAQAEPAAKIAKAVETLERRAELSHAKDVTGSVTPPQPTAVSNPAQPPQPPPPQGPVIEGWFVRDVYRGAAIIQGRRFGVMEVEPGDTVPGVGRVEAIRKQEGRWVVVTSRGLITQTR
ncbi:MAG: hypothetical protein QOG83_1575 [Alphaproteobacteria bacterium]|nr:hypothetical protein [Alphaproteobacteria bacterium]